jgi:nitrate reductase gamma subunit
VTRTRAHPADPRGVALLAFGVLALLVGHAPDAAACSTCFTATEATRQAYYGTTLLLIALPFALAGALGLWLRRAARRREFTASG